ncbi:hypothetical protein [Geothrix paludis]|uniref:hypothetical protein n=1 Tax=Geothrix paludis TaxID=2922722 RepID=UPI001FADEE23|nr:hypothetical protein [Geothrix paludis]
MSEPIKYWLIGIQYLRLTEASCEELVKSQNEPGLAYIGSADWEDYLDATKWSDHSIGIAILFNFFHGMEVLLKGFLALKAKPFKKNHRLTQILDEFEMEYPGTRLALLIRKYTKELVPWSPLAMFLETNGVSIDDWYDALKYPESKKGRTYSHVDLKYGGFDTLHFWRSVGETAILLRKEAVELSKALQ